MMAADLPGYEEAIRRATDAVTPCRERERVDVVTALGRTLAAPIVADRDLPPFNRAMMDGYALRGAEFGRIDAWPVAGTIAAGHDARLDVPRGHCAAIATGAPLPPELDTVVQHEVSDRGDLDGRPVRFQINSITPGHAVHPRGADARAGDELVATGTHLAAHHLGIAAMVGCAQLEVVRQLRVAVLSSGDEVIDSANVPQPHQIRNSNTPMVVALLARLGARVTRHVHVPDEREPTIHTLRDALTEADFVVTIGGISAGDRDHFPAAFDECGVRRVLHGASIQPGRPVFVGTGQAERLIVGLPGNPVSVLACACLFLWPIIRTWYGLNPGLPWRKVRLAESVKPNPRRQAFRPVILREDDTVLVPTWAGSGDLVHTANTTGLVELPVQAEPVDAGTILRFLPWP